MRTKTAERELRTTYANPTQLIGERSIHGHHRPRTTGSEMIYSSRVSRPLNISTPLFRELVSLSYFAQCSLISTISCSRKQRRSISSTLLSKNAFMAFLYGALE